VGSIALVRSDISDTLPGVAISISLVPPLSVVGLTMESDAFSEARGALLLFLANVSAILASGVAVMALFGLLAAVPGKTKARRWRRPGVLVVAALVAVVAIPLATTSVRLAHSTSQQDALTAVVSRWASRSDWTVTAVSAGADKYSVRVIGPPPEPDTAQLQTMLDSANLGAVTVDLQLVPERRVVLKTSG
jgi:uncharacterized membrane protein